MGWITFSMALNLQKWVEYLDNRVISLDERLNKYEKELEELKKKIK